MVPCNRGVTVLRMVSRYHDTVVLWCLGIMIPRYRGIKFIMKAIKIEQLGVEGSISSVQFIEYFGEKAGYTVRSIVNYE